MVYVASEAPSYRAWLFVALVLAPSVLFLSSLLLISSDNMPPEQRATPPNLIYIMTDQQRYDALSIAGNKILSTQNMDRIAREGAYFLNAYSVCPVCGPARTSLLTGLSIEHSHVQTNKHVELYNITDKKTYDEYLVDEEGYVAEYYGKWHAPPDRGEKYSNGVSLKINGPYIEYLASLNMTEPHAKDMMNGTQVQSFNRQPYVTNLLDERHGLPPGSKPKHGEPRQHGVSLIPSEYSLTAFDAKRTIAALERLSQDKSQPFSLHCSFFTPHTPITPSEPFASMYTPEQMIPPANIDDPMLRSPYINANKRQLYPEYRDSSQIRIMIANYYAYIKEVDAWMGKILDAIDRLGLANNSMLVFTSDHGEMLGSHGMIEKNVFYEESVHVPLMIRYPGVIESGRVVKAPVSHIDVFSTILDYLGARAQPSDGESLRRLIENQSDFDDLSEEFAVSEWNYHGAGKQPGLMIRCGRWKLFIPTTVESKVENVLYDLERDPFEMHNLLGEPADREKYLTIANDLKEKLLGWLRKMNSTSYDGVSKREL